MSWMSNLKTDFALASFRLMKDRAREVVEGFPSYAFNRDMTEVLVLEVTVALAAVFWAGIVLGVMLGVIMTGVFWLATNIIV
jgi:hypothetical protein